MNAMIKDCGTRIVCLRISTARIYRFAPDACGETLDPPVAKPEPRLPFGHWLFFGGFILLAGYLAFCHGCHGDEDNELFGNRAVAMASVSRR
jgi:hypothetical protein